MPRSSLKTMYHKLPEPIQGLILLIYNLNRHIPFTTAYRHTEWVRSEYQRFSYEQRKDIFLSIARFCHLNRPMEGYYFEFGCHEANTMRMAWDSFHHLFDWEYVGFDSFEGLPEIPEIDRQPIWEKGKLKTDEQRFIEIVTKHGMPRGKLRTVKGFYDESLTDDLARELLPMKAVVVHVDCDLYTSTVPVLRFMKNFLQRGTAIIFDDWYCFHGDPEKGERRAFREFREENPNLIFEEFVHTNEAQSFIFLGGE